MNLKSFLTQEYLSMKTVINIFFFAKLENNNILQIYYLKCDKDFNCQNPPKLIITPDSDENSGVFAPYVIKIGNIFYIFYGIWGQRGFSIRIGYSSINFENWEKCPKKNLIRLL
jgi:predicted GH43/DUF377 family glycosyl hydrolase